MVHVRGRRTGSPAGAALNTHLQARNARGPGAHLLQKAKVGVRINDRSFCFGNQGFCSQMAPPCTLTESRTEINFQFARKLT